MSVAVAVQWENPRMLTIRCWSWMLVCKTRTLREASFTLGGAWQHRWKTAQAAKGRWRSCQRNDVIVCGDMGTRWSVFAATGDRRQSGSDRLAEEKCMSLDRLKQLAWIYDLNRLGQEAVNAEDNSSVYQRILQHIVNGFEAGSGSLALLDHANNCLTIVAGIDLPGGVIGKRVNMGEGVFGWVTQEGQALLLNGDVSSDPRFHPPGKSRGDTSSNSAICWPLEIEGKTVGCIAVNRSKTGDKPGGRSPFAEADMEQGSAVLDMVSLALSNIQLHIEQTQRLAAVSYTHLTLP